MHIETVAEPNARTKTETSAADVPVNVAAYDKRTGTIILDTRAHTVDRLSPNMEATVAAVPKFTTPTNLTAPQNTQHTKHTTASITPTAGISLLTYQADADTIGNGSDEALNYQVDDHVFITDLTATRDGKLLDIIRIDSHVDVYVANTDPAAKNDGILPDNINIGAIQFHAVVHHCDVVLHDANDENHRSNITNARTEVEDGNMDSHIEQFVQGIETPQILGSADIQTYQNANTRKDDDPVPITTHANNLGTAADNARDLSALTHD